MNLTLKIRQEAPEDHDAIHQLLVAAFEQPGEAQLVNRLRERNKIQLAQVAILDDIVVAHIVFTRVRIGEEPQCASALGLGPVAVLPAFQGQGIGSAIIESGLKQCREMGDEVVVVLGHSDYYPRFGFQTSTQYDITCEYDVPESAFMVLELQDGALAKCRGIARYLPEFNEVS